MKQQAAITRIGERRRVVQKHTAEGTHPQDDFNLRLDAVVRGYFERTPQWGSGQTADEDYAMRWAIARFQRSQSRSPEGAYHVAA